MDSPSLRAADLGEMLGTCIFDIDDAASFLGVTSGTIWMQVTRRRIAYVQYKNQKYFALGDLCDYAAARGKGNSSEVEPTTAYEVVVGKTRSWRVLPRVP